MSSKEPVEIHPFERTSLSNLSPPGDFRPKPLDAFMAAQAAKAAAEYLGDEPSDEPEPYNDNDEGEDSPKESATENVDSEDSPSQEEKPSELLAPVVTDAVQSLPTSDAGPKKVAAKKSAPPLSK